jgi:hypothetical protein
MNEACGTSIGRRLAPLAILFGLCSASSPVPAGDVQGLSGAAAGGTAMPGDNGGLQTCPEPTGTIRLQDGMVASRQAAPNTAGVNPNLLAVANILQHLPGNSPPPPSANSSETASASLDALRLLIQQSNCFVIVDRGGAEGAADDEKQRARGSSEMRDDANMGPGQEVAADFVLRSSVISLATEESRGLNLGLLSRFAGGAGGASQSTTKAKVQLVLSDVRSKIQLAVAQGDGSGSDTKLAANLLGATGKMLGGVGVNSESKTAPTTILLQAFADAFNKLVPAVRNYKSQVVRGGLGAGGTLGVQGARRDPSSVQK